MNEKPLGREELARCRDYLRDHWATPEAYLTGLFARRDVVLLAEDHAIRHNLLLVQRLIPLLHEAGVYALGMEFGASEDQDALDALTGYTGRPDAYDKALGRQLMFNYNVGWPYREYLDVYRAAWAFNRTRPEDARPFRILNLSYRYDWRSALPVRTPEGTKRIFPKGGTEPYRVEVIRREILENGEKILVLTGSIHAWTRFTVPEFDFTAEGFVRFNDGYLGHLLARLAPENVCTVLLHQPFDDKLAGPVRRVRPANGAIDQIMAGFTDARVGFDLDGPLGELRDDSFYSSGRDDFRLSDLADGYVYEMPFEQYEGCTVDEAFVTDDNWPEARLNFPDPHWHQRPETIEEYWRHVRAYVDVARRYADVRRPGDAH